MAGPINEHASALAQEWKRLTRAATFVALLTAPAFFLILFDSEHFGLLGALIITAGAVVVFRGLVEVVTRKLIPSPSLYGADQSLKEDDIVARRRYWFWRGKFRRLPVYVLIVLALLGMCQLLFALGGVSAPFFKPLSGLKQIFPPSQLPQLGLVFIQLPLLFFINFAIFFGPFLFFAVRQIRGYEPGDASWGVKIDDVRGQAEAKEEITRVITLWQSGEEFEKAGGKRERGLLFLGAPGTGKTMISKAIATNFNCPFVTIPGSGFAGMFIGMDAITVQFLARKARKLAAKWGGQCIVFIDEIDAVGMRRQALGGGMGMNAAAEPTSIHDFCFYGPNGALTSSGDLIVESRAWREKLFAMRAESPNPGYGTFMARTTERIQRLYPGFGMGGGMGGGMALNQLLIVMDGIDEPPLMRKVITNRVNTFLDAMFFVPRKVGKLRFRLRTPKPRQEQIYFIGACNVPINVLDPALTRPGRMGRHIWFRTPTKDDRLDILDLYLGKVDHEPDLDTDRRRDELARITNGYSPSMIEQCCSMALTIAHTEGRRRFAWEDIVEAMTTVETGTAQNIEYIQEETRAVAIHEAGHAAAGHIFLEKDVLSTRLSIRKRGGSLGHYQSMEKDERFSHFRGRVMGELVMTLGAMAAEHVFYGENSQGVGGDVQSATATAAAMVGMWAMGPDPVHIAGSLEADDDRDAVLKRLERIGSTIMNRAGSPGLLGDNPIGAVLGSADKKRAAAQILGQAYITAYALMDANREALEKIADALVERKEIYGDEVGALLDSVSLRRPALDLMDPGHMAPGMTDARLVSHSADEPAATTATTPGGQSTRSRWVGRHWAHSPHAPRFRVATVILLGLAAAAVAAAIVIGSHGRGSSTSSAQAWSLWKPTDSGNQGAREIADFLAPTYRISAANQLDVITVVNLESQAAEQAAEQAQANGTTASAQSGLQVAVRPSAASSQVRLLGGDTIAYNLCGIGAKNCAIGTGKPSTDRLLLLRREALELALYTFRYLSGTDNVLAVLPPGHTATTNTLSKQPPTSDASSSTKPVTIAVLFQRQELAPLLDHPLDMILPEVQPPTVAEMAKAPEADLVAQATARGLFSEQLQHAQDGSSLMVLAPLPAQ